MTSATAALVSLLHRPVAAADRERARWHLLDWFGCASHGAAEDAGQRWAGALATGDGAHWSVAGRCATAQEALQLNAALGNIGEMDDVHRRSVLHPGPVVIPTLLAVAAARQAPLAVLCDALIRGYETTIRVGEALGPAHYRYHHSTATAGALGAASAAASILGLDDDRWCDALGNAGSVAGGLWQLRNEQVDTKQWHNANAARVGFEAARLAAAGISGPRWILEGPQGLLAALSDGGDPQRIDADARAPWRLHDCSFKPWPACRHAHPAIDAALQLRRELTGDPIQRVALEVYADALLFCNRPRPRTAGDARFSLQYCTALALAHGEPTLDDFAPGAWERPELQALMARVVVEESNELTAAYPRHFGAVLTVHDASGPHRLAISDTLGDPSRPLRETALERKLAMLLGIDDAADLRRRLQAWRGLGDEAPAADVVAALEALRQ